MVSCNTPVYRSEFPVAVSCDLVNGRSLLLVAAVGNQCIQKWPAKAASNIGRGNSTDQNRSRQSVKGNLATAARTNTGSLHFASSGAFLDA